MLKVFILQEVLPDFRIPFFNRLGEFVDLTVFYSDATALKRRRAPDLSQVRSFVACKTPRHAWRGGRLSWHPAMVRKIEEQKPQVIILEARLGFLTALYTANRFRRRSHIIWWLSGYETPATATIQKLKRLFWRQVFRRAEAFLCYSSAGRDYLHALGMTQQVFIAYNSLDTPTLERLRSQTLAAADWPSRRNLLRRDADLCLLYVGRIEAAKKLSLLLVALQKLVARQPGLRVHLRCVGGGEALEHLQEQAQALGIADVIEFTGPEYRPERLAAFFLSADLFVLPGAGGLAINQAIAYGLPVVLSAADGSERDMVQDGENGLYFCNDDAEDLARQLETLCLDAKMRRRMAAASLQRSATVSNSHAMLKGFLQAMAAVTGRDLASPSNSDSLGGQLVQKARIFDVEHAG